MRTHYVSTSIRVPCGGFFGGSFFFFYSLSYYKLFGVYLIFFHYWSLDACLLSEERQEECGSGEELGGVGEGK